MGGLLRDGDDAVGKCNDRTIRRTSVGRGENENGTEMYSAILPSATNGTEDQPQPQPQPQPHVMLIEMGF